MYDKCHKCGQPLIEGQTFYATDRGTVGHAGPCPGSTMDPRDVTISNQACRIRELESAEWFKSLTPEQLAEVRFYADLESFRKKCAELESELGIERGRVEGWKKDSRVKEKLLNEKCQQIAELEAARERQKQEFLRDARRLIDLEAETVKLKERIQELEFDIECSRGGIGGLSKRDPS